MMKKDKIIYWASTGLVGVMMLFASFSYLTNPEIATAFNHLGFPSYFRVELGIAKAMGALVLLVPQVPGRIKEWAYAGFGIVFISAAIAHFINGDGLVAIASPIVFLVILMTSHFYRSRINRAS